MNRDEATKYLWRAVERGNGALIDGTWVFETREAPAAGRVVAALLALGAEEIWIERYSAPPGSGNSPRPRVVYHVRAVVYI